MNPDPVPSVRLLLTHVIPAELVRCEAGIITLLLDERPTLAFELLTAPYEPPGVSLRIVLLEVGIESLAAGQPEACVSSSKAIVGELDLLENVVLLSLEGGNLIGEARGLNLALVIPLELGDEAPVVQTLCFLKEDQEGLTIGHEDVDEPWG